MGNEGREASGELIARAREKAMRCGTTLEAELEDWLSRYVHEFDGMPDDDREDDGPSDLLIKRKAAARRGRRQARRSSVQRPTNAITPMATTRRPPVRSTVTPADDDSRSEAYRRLIALMRNAPG